MCARSVLCSHAQGKRHFFQAMTIDVVTRQRIVASQGDRAQHFYVLLSGSASVFTTNESTNVTTHLATIGPVSACFPFLCPVSSLLLAAVVWSVTR